MATEEQILPTNIQFKGQKTGTLNPEGRELKKEEKKLLSRVELKRYRYMKQQQEQEASTLDRLKEFRDRLNAKK